MNEHTQLAEPLCIHFVGCMDTAKCNEMEAVIVSSLESAGDRPIVYDLARVEFVSSAFLRLCVLAQRRAGEAGFRVVNVDPLVKRVFKIAGLDFMLDA